MQSCVASISIDAKPVTNFSKVLTKVAHGAKVKTDFVATDAGACKFFPQSRT